MNTFRKVLVDALAGFAVVMGIAAAMAVLIAAAGKAAHGDQPGAANSDQQRTAGYTSHQQHGAPDITGEYCAGQMPPDVFGGAEGEGDDRNYGECDQSGGEQSPQGPVVGDRRET